jgi:DNA-binding MarR family transcriptional regulator
VIGKCQYDFIDPEYHDIVKKTIKQVLATGKVGRYTIKGTGPDGRDSWYETKAGPLKNAGKVVAVILFTSDITDRKRAEKEKAILQHKLKKYAKKLELKVKKLEKNRLRLTEKEKQVFYGLASHPNLNDRELEKKLGLKRVTITSIRNRLRRNQFFRVANIPKTSLLGCQSLSIVYGPLGRHAEEVKRYLGSETKESCFVFSQTTEDHFFTLVACRELIEFRKLVDPLLHGWLKSRALDEEPVVAHFPIELSSIPNFFYFTGLLKQMFEQEGEEVVEAQDYTTMSTTKLTNNMKKVLYALVKYPEANATELSKMLGLTSTTVNKNRDILFREGFIKKALIPNLQKLNFECLVVSHLKKEFEGVSTADKDSNNNQDTVHSALLDLRNDNESLTVRAFKSGADKSEMLGAESGSTKNLTSLNFPLREGPPLEISFARLTKKLLDLDIDI